MRTLNAVELDAVSGGNPVVDFLRIIQITGEIGGDIYSSLSQDMQSAIGGTIDAALANAGVKEPEDVPAQDVSGVER